ncbi:MAG: hypothetical protein DMG49_20370 [Acidobacteria bacterium]|nr:MAG: hypothetical protein DMG49_20370 [Acidobacteriota bacterium]
MTVNAIPATAASWSDNQIAASVPNSLNPSTMQVAVSLWRIDTVAVKRSEARNARIQSHPSRGAQLESKIAIFSVPRRRQQIGRLIWKSLDQHN